jgi:hypothetical protein
VGFFLVNFRQKKARKICGPKQQVEGSNPGKKMKLFMVLSKTHSSKQHDKSVIALLKLCSTSMMLAAQYRVYITHVFYVVQTRKITN